MLLEMKTMHDDFCMDWLAIQDYETNHQKSDFGRAAFWQNEAMFSLAMTPSVGVGTMPLLFA